MVDFINEVEEELRKDKYNALLRKFGPYIMAILVAIVLLAGFIEYQKGKDGREARAASASYVSATKLADAGKTQQALQKFIALSKVAPAGYAGLSLSRAADLELKRGNKEMAVKYFDQAAAKFEQPIHKDMAAYKAALIVMDLGRYDDVRARTNSLIYEDAPYGDLARELSAHADLKTDRVDEAKTKLKYLVNVPGVLPGVKDRARQAIMLLNADSTVDKKEEAQEIPAPQPERPAQPDESGAQKE